MTAATGPEDMLEFWRAAGPKKWFAKDDGFDAGCVQRFRALWAEGAAGRLAAWEARADSALALVLLVLSPIIARLMQFAVSRRRESLADISGVEMTRYPPGLISALEKLQADQTVVHSASRATAHLWIESPLARTPEEGKMSRLNRMFDTHPPLEERIAALQEL